MKYVEQQISGVYLIETTTIADERGSFERISCLNSLEVIGFKGHFVQSSISYTEKKNTLRGMHLQKAPFEEEKLVRCIKGKIYDVVVDLRPHSKTLYEWQAFELSEENQKSLFIPKDCAHGFLTLEGNCQVLYQISEYYSPEHTSGVNYSDPKLNIKWPWSDGERIISVKDKKQPMI